MRVVLYSQATCRRCQAARAWLGRMNIPFEVRDVYGTPGAAEEIRRLQVTMLPAFLIGERVIIGFQPELIINALADGQDTNNE